MKNDSKLLKLVAYVLLLTIASLILVSGTYAKYTRDITGSDTATVAKFNVSSNANSDTTFELFSTVKEADTTTAETDVTSGKIAPGTGGQFAIELKNDSEVSVSYALSLAEENTNNIPIEYSLDGTNWGNVEAIKDAAKGNILLTDADKTKTVTLYWRWAFEATADVEDRDNADTTLATVVENTDMASVKVTVTSTFTQID